MAAVGKWILRGVYLVLALVALTVVLGAAWYVADGRIDADVENKTCSFGGSSVTVVTRLFDITKVQSIQYQECLMVPQGGYVQYYIRSGRTVIWDSEGGDCIWDTGRNGPC